VCFVAASQQNEVMGLGRGREKVCVCAPVKLCACVFMCEVQNELVCVFIAGWLRSIRDCLYLLFHTSLPAPSSLPLACQRTPNSLPLLIPNSFPIACQ